MQALQHLKAKFASGWPLSNLAALLRQLLFIFSDIWFGSIPKGPPARVIRQLAHISGNEPLCPWMSIGMRQR